MIDVRPEALEQARMDEELDNQRITNVNVAQEPTLSEKPVSPSKLMVGALSLALTVAGTTALVLGCEKRDSHGKLQREGELKSLAPSKVAAVERSDYAPSHPR